MGLTETELNNHKIIIERLHQRCNAGSNRHVWGQKLTNRKQYANESTDDCLSDLRDIASKCEFAADCCGDCETTWLLGQVVFGVNNDDVRRKLLQESNSLTLDKAIQILRSLELASYQASQLKHDEVAFHQRTALSPIDSRRALAPPSNASTSERQATCEMKDKRQPTTGCWKCGSKCRHSRHSCPANGTCCHACGKIGHYATVCRTKDQGNLRTIRI
ncbi:hypothetical protein T11_15687 [Trichinella zimbabwensis]|uniref:CCHC-type domain-containing protein n=1 Tax=Trichinella zimbabwensis TaxID=268475 RepID=A0A0V1GY67_9BILA|nr:hypothetical protein T11_15687 [Trichinella zimbabwensis]